MSESRVLIVEDNAEVGRMEADLLRSVGYHAEWTSDDAVLDTMHRFNPDVVVLDLSMATRDGVEIAGMMRRDAQLAQVPIVVASGSRDVRQDASRIGTSYLVIKTFDVDELIDAVRRAERAA
jgi:DNA-binding response OmpR family regulator